MSLSLKKLCPDGMGVGWVDSYQLLLADGLRQADSNLHLKQQLHLMHEQRASLLTCLVALNASATKLAMITTPSHRSKTKGREACPISTS